jgi:hypothetical protein
MSSAMSQLSAMLTSRISNAAVTDLMITPRFVPLSGGRRKCIVVGPKNGDYPEMFRLFVA